MPNYRGHVAGGAAAYGVLLVLLYSNNIHPSLLTAIEWFFFALAGCLFPDIDIKSKGQKYFYRFVLLLFIIFVLKKQIELLGCFSFIAIIPMLVKHRGIFHRLWFVIVVPLCVWIILSYLKPHFFYPLFFDVMFFIAGAISHLWLDLGFMKMMNLHRVKTRK